MEDATTPTPVPGRPDRILLLGVARSGTRWLGSALGHAEATQLVKEPDNVDADPHQRGPGRLGFGPYPLISPTEDAPGYRALWDLSFSARVPNRKGWRRAAARAALRLPRGLRDPLIRRTAQVVSSLPGRSSHVVVKSIYAHFALDWLVLRYQPRVIVIQRDPLNVISSWVELGVHGFDLATRPAIRERYLDPLGIAAPRAGAGDFELAAWWVGLLATVLGQAVASHPDWLVVTHEDLCQDPAPQIRAVCERVGLTWTQAADRFLAESNRPGQGFSNVRVTREQPERWRGRLTAQQVAEIQSVLAGFPGGGWISKPPLATLRER